MISEAPTLAPVAPLDRRAPAAAPILVATPGDDGTAAIETAASLAAHDGRPVSVVSAVELPAGVSVLDGVPYVPDVGAYMEAQRDRVKRQLRTVGEACGAWPVEVLVDEPSYAIADVARARGASLVVLGTGRHDLPARLLGEVALRALRRAPCPVLAVGPTPMRVPPRVAVAAVDFSASSVVAARAALQLLAPGGTLHLVHAWAPHPYEGREARASDTAYESALPGRFARMEQTLAPNAGNVTIVTTSTVGDPVERVIALAQEHGADLIAAGRQGHGLLDLLFVGRVTTALLRAADRAVLVTPEPPPQTRIDLERALAGTIEIGAREEWAERLAAFSRRNMGRRTRLEVDDPGIGAQTAESGYPLLGAAYDRHDGRVTLMFGEAGDTAHLTRGVDGVTSIAVLTGADGRDGALRLTHGTGQTLLTFAPES